MIVVEGYGHVSNVRCHHGCRRWYYCCSSQLRPCPCPRSSRCGRPMASSLLAPLLRRPHCRVRRTSVRQRTSRPARLSSGHAYRYPSRAASLRRRVRRARAIAAVTIDFKVTGAYLAIEIAADADRYPGEAVGVGAWRRWMWMGRMLTAGRRGRRSWGEGCRHGRQRLEQRWSGPTSRCLRYTRYQVIRNVPGYQAPGAAVFYCNLYS